jgi:diacylglycerol kinase (ATP)
LLLNPVAGRGRGRAIARRLGKTDGVQVLFAESARDVVDRAREAARAGRERFLVGGGDGTIHHAIRGLSGSDCALGIVPLGTGNDLARSLAIPRDPVAALHHALTAPARRIDLGSVEGCPFAGVAGIGIDGEVARWVNERSTRPRGRMAYFYAVIRTLVAFRPPHVRIEFDGGSYEGRVTLAALANTSCFGGGMRIAPEAVVDDGAFELIIVEAISKLRFLAIFPRVYRGTHIHHPAVRTFRTTCATLRTDRSLPCYADGEPLAECSDRGTRVEILPRSLAVIA